MIRFLRSLGRNAREIMRVYRRRLLGYPVITNANNVHITNQHRRALLVYLVKPFRKKGGGNEKLFHQNTLQARQIVNILGRHGFIVDVADIQSRDLSTGEKYDIVISHSVVSPGIEELCSPHTIRVYLATGMHHVVHNRNIRRRYERMFERRGMQTLIRQLNPIEMSYVETAHEIFGFGNENTAGTWKETFDCPIRYFNNYGFPNTDFRAPQTLARDCQKNFLFFASGSQVGKGLDLLLEIFPKHPDLHLYVCSAFESEPEFCRVYRKELFDTPNIHPIGIVHAKSNFYNELVSKCAFVVLPSCAEGQPGSIIQCMWSGLIPIVTRETGIDTASFGVTFSDDELRSIEAKILEVSTSPPSWIEAHSYETRSTAEQSFSSERFVDKWNSLVGELQKRLIR